VRVQILSSGSQGNAALVRAGETRVLIDCGLPGRELRARFEDARFESRSLDHILLSHGHLDNARSAGLFSRQSGATVHCAERLMRNRSVARAARLSTLPVNGEITVGSGPAGDRDPLEVRTAHLPHDAEPTVAFRVEQAGRVAVLLTDMGAPAAHVAERLAGAHLLVLEFNHDPELLAAGPYTDRLKRRIRSGRGHLSNVEGAQMLLRLAGPELHTVVLAHLSLRNNRPELARSAAEAALAELGRPDVRVLVARQDAVGPSLEV